MGDRGDALPVGVAEAEFDPDAAVVDLGQVQDCLAGENPIGHINALAFRIAQLGVKPAHLLHRAKQIQAGQVDGVAEHEGAVDVEAQATEAVFHDGAGPEAQGRCSKAPCGDQHSRRYTQQI